MNNITEKTHLVIPMVAQISKILKAKYFYKKLPDKKTKEFDFEVNIRCSSELHDNGKYWTDLLNELVHILAKHLALQINLPHFDNFVIIPHRLLKQLYKSKMPIERKQNVKRLVK